MKISASDKGFNKLKHIKNMPKTSFPQNNQSFKGVDIVSVIPQTGESRALADVFSQYYGQLADNIGAKLGKLANDKSKLLQKSSRIDLSQGALLIKDKKMGSSLAESVIFPFVQMPLYAINWVLKKLKGSHSQKIRNAAENLYTKALFRIPRKLNEMDGKTNAIQGIMGATQKAIGTAAVKLGMQKEDVLKNIMSGGKTEAGEFVRENLYKISNKFFDKNTGNFNTAFERPLNRIVTGLIPMFFLANDAYNLSVMCGDKKEDSTKEANTRAKQELGRIITTAYIQLLIFGAFTKQVNTIPWFTPLTIAATTLFSEISSRKRLKRPIFFLSKEGAIEHNKMLKEKENKKSGIKETTKIQSEETKRQTGKLKDLSQNIVNDKSVVFNTFEDEANKKLTSAKKLQIKEQNNKKPEKKEQKALINFKTFKRGVIILLAAGFALSFLKNSSYTKNHPIIKGAKSLWERFKTATYDKLAFKDFAMEEDKFNEVMKSLKDSAADFAKKDSSLGPDKYGLAGIAAGHEAMRDKYQKSVMINGKKFIKILNNIFDKSKLQNVSDSAVDSLTQNGVKLTGKQTSVVNEAIKYAIENGSTDISEKQYGAVARKAIEIMTNRGILIADSKKENIAGAVSETIKNSVTQAPIKVETKLKPFVDVVTEPFKFMGKVVTFPFRIATYIINMATAKAKEAAVKAQVNGTPLSETDKIINKILTEIYGKPGAAKDSKTTQIIFANAMEQLEKKTLPYRNAVKALEQAQKDGVSGEQLEKLKHTVEITQEKLSKYIKSSVEKSFNGVTQSSNKNVDLAMMSKLAASTVTSAFLVADNYNMVMLKSNGEDKEGAKEKANERIVQRLSALFYQTMLIHWFNSTFCSVYNSSLKGMAAVAAPNTLASEILTRTSIGMPVGRKTIEELNAIDEKNEKRTGFAGKYFKFMRLLTGKKPLKDRIQKNKKQETKYIEPVNMQEMLKSANSNLLKKY